MCVKNRIKVLSVRDFEDAERQVNRFLETSQDIGQLVAIDYRLEFNKVILEYYVLNNNDQNGNYNKNSFMEYWMNLWRPFFYI